MWMPGVRMFLPYPTDKSGQVDKCVCVWGGGGGGEGGSGGGGGSETYSEASWILRSGSRAAEPILLTDSIVTLLWSSESGTQEREKYRSALSLCVCLALFSCRLSQRVHSSLHHSPLHFLSPSSISNSLPFPISHPVLPLKHPSFWTSPTFSQSWSPSSLFTCIHTNKHAHACIYTYIHKRARPPPPPHTHTLTHTHWTVPDKPYHAHCFGPQQALTCTLHLTIFTLSQSSRGY